MLLLALHLLCAIVLWTVESTAVSQATHHAMQPFVTYETPVTSLERFRPEANLALHWKECGASPSWSNHFEFMLPSLDGREKEVRFYHVVSDKKCTLAESSRDYLHTFSATDCGLPDYPFTAISTAAFLRCGYDYPSTSSGQLLLVYFMEGHSAGFLRFNTTSYIPTRDSWVFVDNISFPWIDFYTIPSNDPFVKEFDTPEVLGVKLLEGINGPDIVFVEFMVRGLIAAIRLDTFEVRWVRQCFYNEGMFQGACPTAPFVSRMPDRVWDIEGIDRFNTRAYGLNGYSPHSIKTLLFFDSWDNFTSDLNEVRNRYSFTSPVPMARIFDFPTDLPSVFGKTSIGGAFFYDSNKAYVCLIRHSQNYLDAPHSWRLMHYEFEDSVNDERAGVMTLINVDGEVGWNSDDERPLLCKLEAGAGGGFGAALLPKYDTEDQAIVVYGAGGVKSQIVIPDKERILSVRTNAAYLEFENDGVFDSAFPFSFEFVAGQRYDPLHDRNVKYSLLYSVFATPEASKTIAQYSLVTNHGHTAQCYAGGDYPDYREKLRG